MTHTELCSLNYMDFYFIFIFDLCVCIHVCVCVCEHVHSFPEDQVRALNQGAYGDCGHLTKVWGMKLQPSAIVANTLSPETSLLLSKIATTRKF